MYIIKLTGKSKHVKKAIKEMKDLASKLDVVTIDIDDTHVSAEIDSNYKHNL